MTNPTTAERVRRRKLFITAVLAITFSSTAQAMTFKATPPQFAFTDPRWLIVAEGQIVAGDAARLATIIIQSTIPAGSSVYLNSPGGSVVESIALGRAIRNAGLRTYVGVSGNTTAHAACVSACVFAFMGGTHRFLLNGSTIAVHRFFFSDPSRTDTDLAQITSAVIATYLNDMGISAAFMELMSSFPPNQPTAVPANILIGLNVIDNGLLDAPSGIG